MVTLFGILAGVGMLTWAIISQTSIELFLNLDAVFITLGGTIAATLINFPVPQIKTSILMAGQVFFGHKLRGLHEDLGLIMSLAETFRTKGSIALEDRMLEINDPFVEGGVRLIVDSEEAENIDYHFETELLFLQERQTRGRRMFSAMGKYAPAFGMIGTLIGLISMLQSIQGPDSLENLGPGMAVALVTTFYGALLANLLFLPIAGKLREQAAEEMSSKMLIAEGVTRIAKGESGRRVKEELVSYLPSKHRKAVLEILD